MLTKTKPNENSELERPSRRIGFVGDAGVGKTTVTALVASRLAERERVTVNGEAAARAANCSANRDDALGIDWTVVDCPPGPDAARSHIERLDTMFVVATPDTLERVETYEQIASRYDVDCLLVVNRFRESAREKIRAFDGPPLAEYVYADEEFSTTEATVAALSTADRNVDAILIESLQSERLEADQALEALEAGERSIVNVEVTDRVDIPTTIDSFEAAGYRAAYFGCNCQRHDGHVLARQEAIGVESTRSQDG